MGERGVPSPAALPARARRGVASTCTRNSRPSRASTNSATTLREAEGRGRRAVSGRVSVQRQHWMHRARLGTQPSARAITRVRCPQAASSTETVIAGANRGPLRADAVPWFASSRRTRRFANSSSTLNLRFGCFRRTSMFLSSCRVERWAVGAGSPLTTEKPTRGRPLLPSRSRWCGVWRDEARTRPGRASPPHVPRRESPRPPPAPEGRCSNRDGRTKWVRLIQLPLRIPPHCRVEVVGAHEHAPANRACPDAAALDEAGDGSLGDV